MPNDTMPIWWRRALVALATLVLCSCQAPPVLVSQLDQFVDDLALPTDAIHEISDDGWQPSRGPQLARREIHAIDPAVLDNSRPLDTSRGQVWAAQHGAGCGCGNHSSGCATGPSDEYLYDGGDYGAPVGVREDWTLDGLEQEDTVAHYDTLDKRVLVTPSNRVGIYAPRFGAVRRVESLLAHERRRGAATEIQDTIAERADAPQPVVTSIRRQATAAGRGKRGPILFRGRTQAGGMEADLAIMESFNTRSAYANLEIIRTGHVDGSQQAELERGTRAAVTWSSDQAVQVTIDNRQAIAAMGLRQAGQVYMTTEPDSPKLRLVKLASTHHAQPGEEIEFTLRFDSVGDQAIGNVTIVDNLATRLEYVENSAHCSLTANFTAEPNESGSMRLRWEITQPLEPGEGGVLRFKARVR